jgi:hypothetical protein
MGDTIYTSYYGATYTSFSGSDIVATINNRVIGELQAVSYSVTREKTPIYVMGSPDPQSFSRGKRGIAGSLVFTVFNSDALNFLYEDNSSKIYTAYANSLTRANDSDQGTATIEFLTPDQWEQAFKDTANDGTTAVKNFKAVAAHYADELKPFDITITMQNEYGNAARFSIVGCEILNEGSGMSIDDITTERACTFVARTLSHLVPVHSMT